MKKTRSKAPQGLLFSIDIYEPEHKLTIKRLEKAMKVLDEIAKEPSRTRVLRLADIERVISYAKVVKDGLSEPSTNEESVGISREY